MLTVPESAPPRKKAEKAATPQIVEAASTPAPMHTTIQQPMAAPTTAAKIDHKMAESHDKEPPRQPVVESKPAHAASDNKPIVVQTGNSIEITNKGSPMSSQPIARGAGAVNGNEEEHARKHTKSANNEGGTGSQNKSSAGKGKSGTGGGGGGRKGEKDSVSSAVSAVEAEPRYDQVKCPVDLFNITTHTAPDEVKGHKKDGGKKKKGKETKDASSDSNSQTSSGRNSPTRSAYNGTMNAAQIEAMQQMAASGYMQCPMQYMMMTLQASTVVTNPRRGAPSLN